MKLKHITTKVFINDIETGDKYMVQFLSNTRGIVYKNGLKIDDLDHVGGLANKTKAAIMIKQATGNYKP